MKIRYYFFIFIYVLFFIGCEAVVGHSETLTTYDKIYNTRSCDDGFIDEKANSYLDLLMWYELAGSLKRNCLDYNASNYYFDQAEELYKRDVDLENIALKSVKLVGATLLNDNVDSYRGNVYESIMINTYKGLNFMSIGDFNNARVEFNRALDRQRRAKEEFAKNIEDEIQKLNQYDQNITTIATNKQTQDFVFNEYNSLIFSDFVAYPDFINPFVTYMAGLFFLADKDYKKAHEMLKESLAMQPKNSFLKSEFKLTKDLLKNDKKSKKYIWLIYENGKGLRKNEFRLDVPLFVFTQKVPYIGVAFPMLQEMPTSYEFLNLENKSTVEIANMDRVIKTEFKTKLPFIITKALIRTTLKSLASGIAMNENELLGYGVALFNALTNKADLRGWISLPKNFQAIRVVNLGKNVDIKTSDGELIESFVVNKDKNAIIYINSPIKGLHIVHKIFF